ncbi:hypothetical protein GYA93_15780 [Gordonia desulfuricans]|uniref:Phage tail protein n=1 Tax=Gordonia desulfuricans TaxID=89051 RepID=A0A7K3LS55_9ACTN|nr:hypothetical protein [Gordonia desulfuricans]NDK91032.1 hypothetical protein [Gordonia desulfuricans]
MTAIEISLLGVDGTRWDVAGPLAGRQGAIIAAEQVDGIYDAPITVESDEDADDIGGSWVHTDYGIRDLVIGFHLFDDEYGGAPGQLESDFRKAFASETDWWDTTFKHARLVVKTALSGVRMLTVQMSEAPEVNLGDDRIDEEYFNVKYLLRAYQPMWEGQDWVSPFTTSGTSGSGTVEVWNPTDRPMRQTWTLTRGIWTLPDNSWTGKPKHRIPGGKHPDRTLPLPEILSTDGGLTLTRDRKRLHASTALGGGSTNFLARMQGKWLQYDIPPYTQRQEVPISVTGAPATGARAELIQPRRWSRPWGLE